MKEIVLHERPMDEPVPQRGLPRVLALTAFWGCLAFIVFATLSPIDLRPDSGEPVWFERFSAYAIVTLLCLAAYPRRLPQVVLLLALVVGGLEALQLVDPSRDGRFGDAVEKICGIATSGTLWFLMQGATHQPIGGWREG